MLTLHVEGKNIDELRAKAETVLGGSISIRTERLEVTAEVADTIEKKRPGRPKKEVAAELPGQTALPVEEKAPEQTAPVVPAATYDNVKSLLQKVAQSEKDADKGMQKALKVLNDACGKNKLKELVEADYAKVIDAAMKMLG